MQVIKTKIVKILSDTEVVLGAGFEDGVREGMEFVIYEEGGEIPDPDTGESLGALEYKKGRVRALEPQPKLCVARTGSYTVSSLAGIIRMTSRQEQRRLQVELPENDEHDFDAVVRIGDLVRSIPEPTAIDK